MRKFNFKRVMTLVLSIVLMLTVIPCGAFTASAASQPTFSVDLSEQIGSAAITNARLYTNNSYNVGFTVDANGVLSVAASAVGYTGHVLTVSGSTVSGTVPAAKGVAFAVVVTTSDGAVHVYGYGAQISGDKINAYGTSWDALEAKEYTTFPSMTQVSDGTWAKLVPATRDKVLLWSTDLSAQNDSNNKNNWGYNSYDSAAQMFSLAVPGITVDRKAGETMPADLSEYSLVWLHLPAITVNNYSSVVNVTALKNYLNKGGRVVILAETGSMMAQQGFDYNAGISALVEALGGNVTIASEDNTDSGWTTGINSDSKLMDGVDPSEFGEETYLVFPALTLTGNAQWVAKRSSASVSGVFMAEQAAGKGRLTVFSDFNWYTKNTPAQGGANTDNASILRFFKNLVNDTKANMATVAANGNPNADFGVVTVSTADELDRALTNAVPGVKTTIKLSATVTASRGNGAGLGSAGARFNIATGKDITIDLNGYNIEYDDNGGTGSPATLKNNGTLTVINSSNTPAAIKGTEKAVNNCGSLTVKGDSVGDISLIGTGNQGLEVGPSSKNDIDGATVIGAYAAICDQSKGVNDDDDKRASVSIKNAYLECTSAESCVVWGYNSIGGGVYTFGENVTMKLVGDTGTDKLVCLDENNAISVCLSSGTLSYQDKGNGVYAIIQNLSVKNIDELTEAIKNAADGVVIKLEGDIEGHIEIPTGKNVVLDLNGHKFENTNGRPVTNYGTLKVIDSSDEQTGTLTGSTHGIWNYGTLTVEAGTITGTKNEAIINDKTATSVTVTGGTLRGGYAAICDYDANGTVVLSNCVLEGLGGEWVISSYGANKGGSYTINPGVVLKNEKNPTQLINTDNGVATNDTQVAVVNWDEIVIVNGTVKVNTAPVLSNLETTYNTAKGDIKAREGLTDAQRTALLDKLDREYAAAKKAVGEAKTYADAVVVADKFATDIQLIVEKGKVADEIAAVAKEEIKKIENANNLSDTKKAAWKAQINKAYADAFDALLNAESGDIDGIKSDALEILKGYGSTVANEDIIQLVNDKAAAADSLRKNAEDAKKAIDAMSNLSDTRKTELKNAIDATAEDAENAIMATNSSADAKKALDGGIDAIARIQAAAESESKVNKFIADYLTDANGNIIKDATDENYKDILAGLDDWNALSDAEKEAVKAILAANGSKAFDEMVKSAEAIKTEKETANLPQTGDNSHIYLWMSIMLISLAVLVLLYKKKALLSK